MSGEDNLQANGGTSEFKGKDLFKKTFSHMSAQLPKMTKQNKDTLDEEDKTFENGFKILKNEIDSQNLIIELLEILLNANKDSMEIVQKANSLYADH